MKINPKKAALIGLAATTAFAVSGCWSKQNEIETLYGPPEMLVDDNELEDVYGPPVGEEDDIIYDEEIEEQDPTKPESNIAEAVYGPPEYFEGISISSSEE